MTLLAGDLPDHRQEPGEGGRVLFAPKGAGPVLEVLSRTEKRFLGRTEIAVFETHYTTTWADRWLVGLRHTGGLKRSGIAARPIEGGGPAGRFAGLLAKDRRLTDASLPLDFTRFEVGGGSTGSRARVELMGASHVAIALPPMRSYVRLFDDQRDALLSTLVELGRVLSDIRSRE